LTRASIAVGFAVLASATVVAAAAGPPPLVKVSVFADTGIKLTDIVWTGSRFLYLEHTANTVWAAGPRGLPVTRFASMPKHSEETRCRLSPGSHGFAPGDVYCHAPDNTIYRISPDGSRVTAFAHLPDTATSDGALAFDTTGRFGYELIAATGRSGKTKLAHAAVYAISPSGRVRTVADFYELGGADEVLVAPSNFGTAAGSAILTVDGGSTGELIAIDPLGAVRTLARLPDGPNPIVAITSSIAPPGKARAGLYVTDTNSQKVFFAAASQFARYAGDLVVETELKGQLWLVRPHGTGFLTRRLPTDLPSAKYNLEGGTYISD
jgi:hypothetical protein